MGPSAGKATKGWAAHLEGRHCSQAGLAGVLTSKAKPLVTSQPSFCQSTEPASSQAARALSVSTSKTVSFRPPVALTTGTAP